MKYHCMLKSMAKMKRLTKPNADKNVEQLKLSYVAGVDAKQHSHFEKQFGGSLKS